MIAERKLLPRIGALVLAACVALAPALAAAQTDEERAGARAAAQEGENAYKEGRWAECIDLFTRAESLVHALPHLIFLARAHEKLGQLVRSRETYLKISREQLAPTAPKAFADAQATAKAELKGVEKRLPYVSVVVQGSGASLIRVTMDGVRIPEALIGVPRPVDPGEHAFQAFADGLESTSTKVTLAEAAKETVVLTLRPVTGTAPVEPPPAAAPGTAATPAAGAATPPTATPVTADEPTDGGGSNGLRIGAYVALGVGVVGLGAGTFFLIQKGGKATDADDLFNSCDPNCTNAQQQEVRGLEDDEKSAGTLSTVSFIVGGVGVAAGITMFVLSSGSGSKEARAPRGPRVTPYIGYQSAGVVGSF